jgi:hypothetical protein
MDQDTLSEIAVISTQLLQMIEDDIINESDTIYTIVNNHLRGLMEKYNGNR